MKCDKYCDHYDALKADNERLTRERDEARKGLAAVEALIGESAGVYGLHLNGDPAPWHELRGDGRFCEWLADFDAALAARLAEVTDILANGTGVSPDTHANRMHAALVVLNGTADSASAVCKHGRGPLCPHCATEKEPAVAWAVSANRVQK